VLEIRLRVFENNVLRRIFGTNVVVEWLALLLRIREIPGSNLSPETGYPAL
jgi:hypothetical protein